VFTLYDGDLLRHVVVIAPMPYQTVYEIQQLAEGVPMEDPSLWWGLSMVVEMISNGTLLTDNPNIPDDGYLQVRPKPMSKEELIPIDMYRTAVQEGSLLVSH
jgi:hypothetical protein